MKKIALSGIGVAIVLIGGIAFVLSNQVGGVSAQRMAATVAPLPTDGPPAAAKFGYPMLEHPLTREQAIARAFEIDARFATWQEPWAPDMVDAQPSRFTVEWHADRGYDGDWYGPGAEPGPLWVITIKGPVRLQRRNELAGKFHDGLVYRIAQNSGSLLGYSAGAWID